MTTKTTANFDKMYDYVRENHIWDDIHMDIAEDLDGQIYIIFDSHEDIDKFSDIVKEVLKIEDKDFYVDDVLGVNTVFSDEYTTCSECNSVIRTLPSSYHWQPDFYIGDGFIACSKCFNDDMDIQEEYIEEKINEPKKAINGLVTEEQIEALGFTKLDNEYENGWYHVEDNPEEIYELLKDKFEDILFFINNVEQFRINFVVFVRGEIIV